MPRTLIADLKGREMQPTELKGWIRRIRETKSTTFIVLQDCSGASKWSRILTRSGT